MKRPSRFALLAGVLIVLTALAAWVNSDALRRWQYSGAQADALLADARRAPDDLLLTRVAVERLLDAGRGAEARELIAPMEAKHPDSVR